MSGNNEIHSLFYYLSSRGLQDISVHHNHSVVPPLPKKPFVQYTHHSVVGIHLQFLCIDFCLSIDIGLLSLWCYPLWATYNSDSSNTHTHRYNQSWLEAIQCLLYILTYVCVFVFSNFRFEVFDFLLLQTCPQSQNEMFYKDLKNILFTSYYLPIHALLLSRTRQKAFIIYRKRKLKSRKLNL